VLAHDTSLRIYKKGPHPPVHLIIPFFGNG
jgi:hypothetical protein